MSDELDDFIGPSKVAWRRGCRICGAPVTARVIVQIRRSGAAGSTRSVTASLCTAHAIKVFTEAAALVEAA